MTQVFSVLISQIAEIWRRFGINQKVSIILALLACIGALAALMYWSGRPDYRLLYSGLTLKDAAAMREKLDEAKIPLQIQDSGHAIHVPAGDVYRAKLLLAANGLPKDSATGFELFEQPKFGLTDFAQQINYQRALQGELERTLMAMSGIQAARVTLVLAKDKIFASEKEKSARASIMLTLAPGASLSGTQIRSIVNLTASSVPGLEPTAITVADQDGRLLSSATSPDEDNMVQAGDQMTIQKTLETQMAKNVQDMLDAFLGVKRSIVKVNTELDFSRVEKRNEKYDKEGRVVKSEKTQSESSTKPGSSVVGAVGTKVNVSDPDTVRPEVGAPAKTKKENIQTEYAVPSGVERILETGARVKRQSVSVCVAKGETPRTEAQLAEIKALVSAAVGAVNDTAKGRVDFVEVREMEFQKPDALPLTPWWLKLPVNLEAMARGILLTILLVVVFFAGRRIMGSASVHSADIGMPVRQMSSAESSPSITGKDVDVDLFETMQAVKEDPKKAAAWIKQALSSG